MSGKIWLVSDTHWLHSNICVGTSSWTDKSGCRNFQTLQEHDETILENLNSLVMPEDILFHLGDFSVGSKSSYLNCTKQEAYRHFRTKIKCNKIFYIRGNHSLPKYDLDNLGIFEDSFDYHEFRYKSNFIVMSHFPFRSWNYMSKSSIHCYGHCHHTNYKDSIYGRSMDIGVDGNNFKPWLLEDVIEVLSSQISLKEGHHI